VRVEKRTAGARRDVLKDKVFEGGTFARAGPADDEEMLKTPRTEKFKRREIFLPLVRIELADESQLHSRQRRIATNIQRRNALCWRSSPGRELP
jgi:hypothetical protein